MRPAPIAPDETDAQRVLRMIQWRGTEMGLSGAEALPSPGEVADILLAIAFPTVTNAALAYSLDPDEPWRESLSMGRFFHAVADAISWTPPGAPRGPLVQDDAPAIDLLVAAARDFGSFVSEIEVALVCRALADHTLLQKARSDSGGPQDSARAVSAFFAALAKDLRSIGN